MNKKLNKLDILLKLKDVRTLENDNRKRSSELHKDWDSDHPAVKELEEERSFLWSLRQELQIKLNELNKSIE